VLDFYRALQFVSCCKGKIHFSPLWLGCGKGRLGFVLNVVLNKVLVEDVLKGGTSSFKCSLYDLTPSCLFSKY
jgi:hypothetical protein